MKNSIFNGENGQLNTADVKSVDIEKIRWIATPDHCFMYVSRWEM